MPKPKNPDPTHFRRTKPSISRLTWPKTAIRTRKTEQAFGPEKPFLNKKKPFHPATMSRFRAYLRAPERSCSMSASLRHFRQSCLSSLFSAVSAISAVELRSGPGRFGGRAREWHYRGFPTLGFRAMRVRRRADIVKRFGVTAGSIAGCVLCLQAAAFDGQHMPDHDIVPEDGSTAGGEAQHRPRGGRDRDEGGAPA